MKILAMLAALALALPAFAQVDQKARIHKSEPIDTAKSKAKMASPCCSVTAINAATGAVTLKDNKTGQTFSVAVQNKARLGALKVGQRVSRDLH